MKAAFAILFFPLLISCAGLPKITPAGRNDAAPDPICTRPFLNGGWRLVHSIDGTMPGGVTAAMIGITVATPESGALRSTLMSIEGLVLLDADYKEKLIIRRGIGPLASPDMVMGMVRDIKLMLFAPVGAPVETGTLPDGSRACRYRGGDGGTIDVVMKIDGAYEVFLYDEYSKVSRRVRYSKFRSNGIPAAVELTASGTWGYTLKLDLVEAERVR